MILMLRRGFVVILDVTGDDVLCFGEGPAALCAAAEFLNRLALAEHAAYVAGFAL